MSGVATSPPPAASDYPGVPATSAPGPPPDPSEACPLCGNPLQREQEWCLRCGAAARTRLAATPNWRAPIAAIVAVVALSLGVLTAALVDLAGNSSTPRTQVTRTVTAPAVALPAPAGQTATPTGVVPGVTPGVGTPGATTTRTASPPATTTGAARTGSGAGTAIPPPSSRTGTGSIIPGVTIPGTSTTPLPRK